MAALAYGTSFLTCAPKRRSAVQLRGRLIIDKVVIVIHFEVLLKKMTVVNWSCISTINFNLKHGRINY